MEDFATLLTTSRERLGLTQAQLALSAGLTPSYVCLLENRKKPPPSDSVCERLAAVLGVPLREVLAVAHLQRSPTTVQRQVRALHGKLSRERKSRHRVLESLLSPFLLETPANWIEGAVEWLGGGAARNRRLKEVLAALGRRRHDQATAVSKLLDELPERDRRLLLEALPRLLGERDRRDVSARTPELYYALPPAEEAPRHPFLLAWSDPGGTDGELRDGDHLLVDPKEKARVGDLVLLRGPDGTPMARRLLAADEAEMGARLARDGAGVVVEIRRPLRGRSS
ncbi:MAG: helix-turn-helix domain-containing protein [Planctomycetota bacterium]